MLAADELICQGRCAKALSVQRQYFVCCEAVDIDSCCILPSERHASAFSPGMTHLVTIATLGSVGFECVHKENLLSKQISLTLNYSIFKITVCRNENVETDVQIDLQVHRVKTPGRNVLQETSNRGFLLEALTKFFDQVLR